MKTSWVIATLLSVSVLASIFITKSLRRERDTLRSEFDSQIPEYCFKTTAHLPDVGEAVLQLEGGLWRVDSTIPARLSFQRRPAEDGLIVLGFRKINQARVVYKTIVIPVSGVNEAGVSRLDSIVGPGFLSIFPQDPDGIYRISVGFVPSQKEQQFIPSSTDLIVRVKEFRDAVVKPTLLERLFSF